MRAHSVTGKLRLARATPEFNSIGESAPLIQEQGSAKSRLL